MKLDEAFFDYKPTPSFLKSKIGKEYPIFVDPTPKEMKEFKDEGFRFLADAEDKKLYIFNVYILHQLAANDFLESIDLYTSPHILAGTVYKGKIDELVPFGIVPFEDFDEMDMPDVFDDEFYEELKKHDWKWLSKYFDTSELKKVLSGL